MNDTERASKPIEYKRIELDVCCVDGGDFKSVFSYLLDCKKRIPEELLDQAWVEVDSNGDYQAGYFRPATVDELARIKADYEAEAVASEANAARIRKYAASL